MAVERTTIGQIRQGDVLLTPQPHISPERAKEIARTGRNLLTPDGHAVLATGQGGGHPHEVQGSDLIFVESNANDLIRQQPDDQVSRMIFVGNAGAQLVHDEHEASDLVPNTAYVVFRQLETLVGDDNLFHQTTGIKANDRDQPSRRYVAD